MSTCGTASPQTRMLASSSPAFLQAAAQQEDSPRIAARHAPAAADAAGQQPAAVPGVGRQLQLGQASQPAAAPPPMPLPMPLPLPTEAAKHRAAPSPATAPPPMHHLLLVPYGPGELGQIHVPAVHARGRLRNKLCTTSATFCSQHHLPPSCTRELHARPCQAYRTMRSCSSPGPSVR